LRENKKERERERERERESLGRDSSFSHTVFSSSPVLSPGGWPQRWGNRKRFRLYGFNAVGSSRVGADRRRRRATCTTA
jgi:hypothetical protein